MKTFMQNPRQIKRSWYLIDAEGKILGRLATRVASLLHGKNKREFTSYVDGGDEVIVINAAKVRVTGKKLKQKIYQRYSGYPDGRKIFDLATMLSIKPEQVIKHAVKGMLPQNPMGRKMLNRLKVYADNTHPHQAQNPQELKI